MGKRRRMALTVLSGLALVLISIGILSMSVGAFAIPPAQVISIIGDALGLPLVGEFSLPQQAVILEIRLPRILLGGLIGAALAVSGAAMQGLFRNPLADPALIGVSAGGALAAVAVIVLSSQLGGLLGAMPIYVLLPLAAFLGGFATTLIVYRLATQGGRTVVTTMLLAGIAINAIAGAGTGMLTYLADDEQLRTLTFWTMGSLGGATWTSVWVTLPFVAITLGLLPRLARALNALLLGESDAAHLGFDVERVKLLVVLLVALAVGGAVAAAGIIGFIGLVVPHLLRLAIGPDHRFLVPGSALLGATLLPLADLLARTVVSPAELPIGIVTALVGGPFFLCLLLRDKRRYALLS